MTFDLNAAVQSAVAKALDPERVHTLIDDQIRTAIDETLIATLKSQLRSYSDFGKELEKVVNASLKLEPIQIPSYNHALTQFVARTLQETSQSLIQQQVASRLKELMDLAPASIKLSELVETYRKRQVDEIEAGCTCEGDWTEIVVELKLSYPDRSSLCDYYTLSFWPSREDRDSTSYYDKRPKAADVVLNLHVDHREDGTPKTSNVQSLRYRDGDTTQKMFVGPLYDFEKLCFNLQASKSVIEWDVDEDTIQDLDLSVSAEA